MNPQQDKQVHTPTPWKINNGSLVSSTVGDHSIAKTWSFHDGRLFTGITVEKCHANAAFIVRACNIHDALVGVIKDLEWIYDSGYEESYCPCCGNENRDGHENACKIVAVLKLAQEEA